jgi:excisionase family DNA binding protein
MDSFEKMYSVKEVAAFLSVSSDTIRRLIYRGRMGAVILPAVSGRRKRVFRSARIAESEVRKFLDQNRN